MTHESSVQMSLFEDPKLEYYRKWDRQYDEEKAKAEDARMLAYERKIRKFTNPAEHWQDYMFYLQKKNYGFYPSANI